MSSVYTPLSLKRTAPAPRPGYQGAIPTGGQPWIPGGYPRQTPIPSVPQDHPRDTTTVEPRPVGPNNPIPPPYGYGQPQDRSRGGGTVSNPWGAPSNVAYDSSVMNQLGAQAQGSGTTGATPFWQSPGIQVASQRVTGRDIMDDPAIAQALSNFQTQTRPQIQNAMALAGLSSSNATANALSQAQGNMLMPLYQDAFAREQARIAAESGATESELARRERSSQAQANALAQQAQLLMGLGQQQTSNLDNAIQTAMSTGATEREIRQQYGDAAYNDFLRRQGLAETSVFGQAQSLFPSLFGSLTRQSK